MFPLEGMSFLEQIENTVLPNALAIGVAYELFWTLTPKELEPFKKAFSIEQEIVDMNNWQLGNYIRFAVGDVLSGGKNKYPNRPFLHKSDDIKELTEEDRIRIGKENNELVKLKILERARRINPILEKKKKNATQGGEIIDG